MVEKQPACLICGKDAFTAYLSLGALPSSNRFRISATEPLDLHPLVVGRCDCCGLIQLIQHAPVYFVIPRIPWIRYNEPVDHLAQFAEKLINVLPGSVTLGLGPFDSPLLEIMERLGSCIKMANLPVFDADSGVYPYLETIQEGLSSSVLQHSYGQSDFVVCRYVFEHCHDPVKALNNLRGLVKDNGFLIIEVPDSTKFLERCDYSFIWEEHISYFTEVTLRKIVQHCGFKLVELFRQEGQLEDALLLMLQPGDFNDMTEQPVVAYDPFLHYCERFVLIKTSYQQLLAKINASGTKVAIFGAGHQAVMFINALELHSFISLVVDDDAKKQGYIVPGTELNIVSSQEMLEDHSVAVCLLAVSPRIETAIVAKCADLIRRGGRLYSIFPGSNLPLLIEP